MAVKSYLQYTVVTGSVVFPHMNQSGTSYPGPDQSGHAPAIVGNQWPLGDEIPSHSPFIQGVPEKTLVCKNKGQEPDELRTIPTWPNSSFKIWVLRRLWTQTSVFLGHPVKTARISVLVFSKWRGQCLLFTLPHSNTKSGGGVTCSTALWANNCVRHFH